MMELDNEKIFHDYVMSRLTPEHTTEQVQGLMEEAKLYYSHLKDWSVQQTVIPDITKRVSPFAIEPKHIDFSPVGRY